ncbi:hypothetical protein [Pseudomonas sp. D3-10]|uniref:hypothetical protein n=1 Tax=Pseudomonas sp. D3-10 TaxID=2817392 RepID=UPI003DA81E76
MPLKDTNCRNAKPQDKPYRLYDEQGLIQSEDGSVARAFLGRETRAKTAQNHEVAEWLVYEERRPSR